MINLAISMTLLGGAPASGVIVFGKDIKTGLPPILDYGVPGRGIEDQAKFVMELPFNQYMDSFPDEKDGLWGVVREVLGTDICNCCYTWQGKIEIIHSVFKRVCQLWKYIIKSIPNIIRRS